MQDDDFSLFKSEMRGVKRISVDRADTGKPRNDRQPVGAGLRHYVMPHDLRIAQLTGQPFGKDYFDGLLRDTSAVFDSAPPTAAVLAAEALDGLGAAMLARIQRAHYVEGRRIAERPVLLELGAELGLGEGFAEAFDEIGRAHV